MNENFDIERWKQLHEIARHYDTQLRAIPVLALTIIGLEMGQFSTQNFFSIWNVAVAGGTIIVVGFLLLLFYKVHFQQLRISKILKKDHDDDLASFYTIEAKDIVREIKELQDGQYPYRTYWFQRWVILQSAGRAVKTIMFLTIGVNIIVIGYIVVNLIN